MNQHPYIRAYMAGIAVPTVFLLVVMTAFTVARCAYDVPVPIERVIVFPMAIVPNLWGAWNVLWLALRRRVPIGGFGAILPFLLVPGAYVVTRVVDFPVPPAIPRVLPFAFVFAVAVYYLVWKYLVASLNRIVGIG
jgi:hypothetical protein